MDGTCEAQPVSTACTLGPQQLPGTARRHTEQQPCLASLEIGSLALLGTTCKMEASSTWNFLASNMDGHEHWYTLLFPEDNDDQEYEHDQKQYTHSNNQSDGHVAGDTVLIIVPLVKTLFLLRLAVCHLLLRHRERIDGHSLFGPARVPLFADR